MGRWQRGHRGPPWAWRHGSPPWWPENEPWPPAGQGPEMWLRMRRHFFRRFAVGVVMVIVLTAGLSALSLWAVGALLNGVRLPDGWSGVAQIGVTVIVALVLVGTVLGRRVFHGVAGPVGALLESAARVGDGDYSARVPERGPREVRTLARTFNAMTERLQRDDEQRKSLLADISHELRTPLTVIEGNLEGLLDGVYPRDDAHLSLVLEETRILSRLIDDLRTFALAESAGLKLIRAPTRLDELAGELVASFAAQAEAGGVRLHLEMPRDLPPALVDSERIRQVLSNLVSNALRYTAAGGTVHVRGEHDAPGRIAIAVADTGSGIQSEDLPHIFDRFYKSKESRGTGLGLAIAKSLVLAHGGEITVSSTPGSGTTIRFTVPIDY
jgi:signal transduction histidine kinase